MKTEKSETEIRMGGRYSIRKPGCPAYATTNNLLVAQRLYREANRVIGNGYQLVDNKLESFLAVHMRDNKSELSK